MKKYILFFIMALLLPVVFANPWNWNSGGAGFYYTTPTTSSFTLYGSNFPNYKGFGTNTSCAISGSIYEPLADDVDGDGQTEIIVFPTTRLIEIYSNTCELEISFVPSNSEEMKHNPVLTDIDGDVYREIIFLTNTSVHVLELEHDYSTIDFYTDYTSNYTTQYSKRNLEGLVCNDLRPTDSGYDNCDPGFTGPPTDTCFGRCFMHEIGSKSVYSFNPWAVMEGGTIYYNAVSNVLNNNSIKMFGSNGISGSKTPSDWYYVNCWQADYINAKKQYCSIINASGGIKTQVIIDFGAATGLTTTYNLIESYIAKVGNNFGVLSRFINDGGGAIDTILIDIHDLNGNRKYTPTSESISGNPVANLDYSNWVVADIDKDGDNDACVIDSTPTTLKCLDSITDNSTDTYTLLTNEISNSDIIDLVIADFDSTSDKLGFATHTGVFYWNDTDSGNYSSYYSSGIAFSLSGNTITACMSSLNVYLQCKPMVIYSTSSIGYIWTDTESSNATCGDGVCGLSENLFSCYIDCFESDTGWCFSDADCPTNFPHCINTTGKCVAGFNASQTCVYTSDCGFNEVCYNGYCISSVSGGIDENETVILEGDITDIFESLSNGNSKLKWFMGFIMVVLCCVAVAGSLYSIGVRSGMGWAILGGLFLGIVMATVFGVFPIYILILFIVMCVGVGFMMFKSSSGAGG